MQTLLLLSSVILLGSTVQIRGESQGQWGFDSPTQYEYPNIEFDYQIYQSDQVPQKNAFVSDQSAQQNAFGQTPNEQASYDYGLGTIQLKNTLFWF